MEVLGQWFRTGVIWPPGDISQCPKTFSVFPTKEMYLIPSVSLVEVSDAVKHPTVHRATDTRPDCQGNKVI